MSGPFKGPRPPWTGMCSEGKPIAVGARVWWKPSGRRHVVCGTVRKVVSNEALIDDGEHDGLFGKNHATIAGWERDIRRIRVVAPPREASS